MVLSRSILFGSGLLLAPLLLQCNHLPPLQTVDLDTDRGDLRQFEGRWFEAFDGYLMVVVQGGERPRFSIRLSEQLRLKSASLEEGDLLFRFHGAEGDRALCLRPVENSLVLIPRGGSPSWCGTCTPYLERNRSLLKVARQRASFAIETFQATYNATWDWLVDVL